MIKFDNSGRVIWITGLSGAGKTTLAATVVSRLRMEGYSAVLLDGDTLREVFGVASCDSDNHCRQTRLALAMKYAHLCRVIAAQGLTVVIATISMFREVHDWNRSNLEGYIEVYLKVPLDELRRRDPKRIYSRFNAGELVNVAGLDLDVDEPEQPDLVLEYVSGHQAYCWADALMHYLKEKIGL